MLTQKFPAPNFTAVTKFAFTARTENEEAGLIIMGIDYSYFSLKKTATRLVVYQSICKNAEGGKPETRSAEETITSNTVYFKVKVENVLPTSADYKTFKTA